MVKVSRRWLVLGGTLVLTLIAAAYPVEDVPVARKPRPARTAQAVPAAPNVPVMASAEAELADVDPFAPRGWQAEPPPVAATVVAVVEPFVGPLPPAPPPPLPPLPFQFMGRLNDGVAPVVYLSNGDKTLIARTGEVLEQNYRVLNMNARQIEFQYVPTGEKQLMSLPALEN